MRNQPRRILAAAATAALVSGVALASAPAALAAPAATGTTQGTQASSPVTVALVGLPDTVKAGGAPIEFSATLRNTADHQIDVLGSVFTIADTGIGSKPSQFKLEYQAPGGTQWKDATPSGGIAGGLWDIDRTAGPHLAPGAEVAYRLRLTVTADAPAGRVAPGFNSVASDPTLPPEQRTSFAMSGSPSLVIAPAVTPTTPATTPAATADVRLDGVPAVFTAGAEARPLKLVLTNNSGKDLRLVPAVVFQGQDILPSGTVEFEFQAPNGDWLAGAPGGDSDHPSWLYLGLRTGSKDADVITLPKGGTRTINARLAFTKDAPALAESLVAIAGTLPGAGESAAEASSPKADFNIAGPAGSVGTPAPTTPATGTAPAATDPSTAPSTAPAAVPAAQVTTGAPSPAADAVKAAAAAPAAVTATRLASTGGGSSAAPMAITGATAIALGIGTLVVARRRNGAQGARN
ncbi:hypothetical protein ACIG5E_27880 [Kitasatospora sp. NPDC053057]|uniref:hypothetical protein n=1 Tax=Kitasatospora sp. NPDC053057 TaxID=3364062 RepID=UPI0037C6D328